LYRERTGKDAESCSEQLTAQHTGMMQLSPS